jgi:aminoglycoside phosphotransferase family enzyme/predicted kinase
VSKPESKAVLVNNAVSKNDSFIKSLLDPSAFLHSISGPVELRETHISWVILAGDFAYKIKKPITTDFLDYSTLSKRHHACCEELRLGNRYSEGLYLDVVPITLEEDKCRVDGDGQPFEFAVRMRRFPDAALLSRQLESNLVTAENIIQLAGNIANFHDSAMRLEQSGDELVSRVVEQAKENFQLLTSEPLLRHDPTLKQLERWTISYFDSHELYFRKRLREGFVRECHGDLHCDNVVLRDGHFSPFDGIEFNSEYSWIDVASDISFLVMDLEERGHEDFAAILLNAYLEQTGDYRALSVLRWYLVYRALVRAKVAVIRARQVHNVRCLDAQQVATAFDYIRLADRTMRSGKRCLWITHGVSGSGKTAGSRCLVEKEHAIRIRSDIERKRLYKTSTATRSNDSVLEMYSPRASEATYDRLFEIARDILRAEFPVVVDATFLKRTDRQRFHMLAKSEDAEFNIVDFQAAPEILRARITHRRSTQNDASDATLAILANQLIVQEPLTDSELEMTVDGNGLFAPNAS